MIVRHLPDHSIGNLGMSFSIPESVDKYIGDSGEADSVKEYGGVYNNPEATAYINKIGQTLVKNSSRPNFGYKFGIVKSEIPNAFALPNGSLYITIGLLRLLRNEAELANVMGHEVSHVTQRHTIKQLQVDLGATAFSGLLSLFLSGQGQDDAKQLSYDLITNGYSQENESDADKFGQGVAAKSGWNPKGMVDLMQIFDGLEKAHPSQVAPYKRSHPYAVDRVKAATSRAPTYQQPASGGVDGEDTYKNFFDGVLKVPPAPEGSLARISMISQNGQMVPTGFFDANNAAVAQMAGIALIGVSALALIYFFFIKRD